MLDALLEHPHRAYPSIRVAGTDGKGSTSSMIASILIEAGYRVGTFNTPSIGSARQMIKINGIAIAEKEFAYLVSYISDIVEKYDIDSIDKAHLMNIGRKRTEAALLWFREQGVDVAVLEGTIGAATCPLGVVSPIISLLTNITADHLELFENDINLYAHEKAGIIKPHTPIYVGETPKKARIKDILIERAKECEANLIFTDTEEASKIIERSVNGSYSTLFGDIKMGLGGDYQWNNLNLVLNAVQELREQGWNISDENIVSGLAHIYKNTGFCGRWQTMLEKPRIILDCGHTPDAWSKIVPQLKKMKYNRLHIVYQACADKDIDAIVKLLPDTKNIEYWFPKYENPRLATPSYLMEKTERIKKSIRHTAPYIEDTLSHLISNIEDGDVIFIGGSCKNVHRVNQYFNEGMHY